MAQRNNRGRNLFSSTGSQVSQARFKALQKAREMGIGNKLIGYLQSAGSVQAVTDICKRFNIDMQPSNTITYNGAQVENINFGSINS